MLLTQQGAEYRYERKFQVDINRKQVEHVVRRSSAAFSPIYSHRWVNNIYLDTPQYASYQANVDGAAHDRVKIRIRWYGDFSAVVAKPVLEFKIKHGNVNRKTSYPLAALDLTKGIGRRQIHESMRRAELPRQLLADLLKLDVAIANRYYRSYFLSKDRNYRITVDTDVAFFRLPAHRTPRFARWSSDDSIILELKYAPQLDTQAAYISQQFPFRVTRSSKYASGIESIMQSCN